MGKRQKHNKSSQSTVLERSVTNIFTEELKLVLWYMYQPHPYLGLDASKTCLRGFANNTGADQPAHPRSLISAFVNHFLESIIYKLATGKISNFLLVWFESRFVGTPKTGFVATRPSLDVITNLEQNIGSKVRFSHDWSHCINSHALESSYS